MSTIREMREVCQLRRPNARGRMVWVGHWFNRFVSRWVSIYFTWLCVRLNISANAVSLLLIFVGLAGFALCITPLLWLNIVGALLLLLQEVLDCVDGEIARWTKKSSLKGLYLDRVGHVICDAPVSCMCALHIYFVDHQPQYLVLAFLAYAMSQIRMGFKEEYFRILLQIPQDKIVSDAVQNNCLASNMKRAIRLLSLISVDIIFIKIVSILVILFFDEGIEWFAVLFCWFIIIATALEGIATTINRYFKYIPDIEHTKKYF